MALAGCLFACLSVGCSVHDTILEQIAGSLGEETMSVQGETESVTEELLEETLPLETVSLTPVELPRAYDYREVGKMPTPKNQAQQSVCWAAASLSAMESSLLPEESENFSMEHMAMNNSFGRDISEGGNYLQALAYLLAWQGPVREQDDPSGDGVSNAQLSAVKHLQEAQILPEKDYEQMKQWIYQYGGVHSCIYVSDSGIDGSSYYSMDTNAYAYQGSESVNHDITIIGWDDDYPKENFTVPVSENGAFLCMNSWGEEFGEDGCFWVSYEDTTIGIYSIVYSRIESVENYDKIYQSDLCGWLGTLGFDSSSAYMANVYTPEQDEQIEAVGFYAVGAQTSYRVYVIPQFTGEESLEVGECLAAGVLENEGYYTISLNQPVSLQQGQPFAVMVYLDTPDSSRPIAIEFATGTEDGGRNVDVSDGQGYISHSGKHWNRTENSEWNCNVCLKAYTTHIEP